MLLLRVVAGFWLEEMCVFLSGLRVGGNNGQFQSIIACRKHKAWRGFSNGPGGGDGVGFRVLGFRVGVPGSCNRPGCKKGV